MQIDKKERYELLLTQVRGLLADETNLIANMANLSAAIYAEFKFHWVGFYLIEGDELVLGPFQGPVACTRIKKGKGVCGTAWATGTTQIVADVDAFPGHIACSAYSKSEIVLPVYCDGKILAVLDIDSDTYNTFSEEDSYYMAEMLSFLCK